MIHTGMLTLRDIGLTYQCYQAFGRLPGTQWSQKEQCNINYDYRPKGLILLGKKFSPAEGQVVHILMARINFNRLVTQEGGITVATEPDYPDVEIAFNLLMEEIGLPSMQYWTVSRLDYCVNIQTPNAATYVKLLKRGIVPWWWRDRYIHANNDYGQQTGSVYLVPDIDRREGQNKHKTGARILNIYDKADQLRSEGASPDQVAEAEGILRVEVQCLKPRLKTIKKRMRLHDMSLSNLWSADICSRELQTALYAIAGTTCDYSAKGETVKALRACSGMHTATRERLRAMLDYVATHTAWGLNQWREEHGARQTREDINRLSDLGINPVTINDKRFQDAAKSKVFDILPDRRIASVFTLLEQAMKEENGYPDSLEEEPENLEEEIPLLWMFEQDESLEDAEENKDVDLYD